MKYKQKKYPIAFLIAALMTCQPISAQAAAFADMNQVPWPGAEVSINKAANLGLVVGETINGKSYFRPKDSVSLCESAQLAYKVLLNTGKIKADSSVTEKWTLILSTYKIPTWAHTAISMCLDKGIVSITDLGTFMSGSSTKAATREQAAEILGRALTVGDSSYTANATTTKFVDNASISSNIRPYVAVLNQAGIVNGDDTNRFNPKSTLNRTETAVMVTNLYEKLNGSSSVVPPTITTSTKTGTVAALTQFYVNFENSNAYYLYSANGATITLNGAASSVSELVKLFKEGTSISATLTLDSNTRITKLEAKADIKPTEVKGTVKELSKTSIKIDTKSYKIDNYSNVEIKINGSKKTFSDLQSLYKDEETITATLTLDKNSYVTKIDATTKTSSSTTSNQLTDIKKVSDKDYEGYIKVDTKKYYVEDIDDITVTIDGKTEDFEELLDAFKALKTGESFTIKVTLDKSDDDYVTKIVATTTTSTSTKKGVITDLVKKTTSKYAVELDENKSYTIKDIDDVSVKIDGKTKDFDDLKEIFRDDEMEITATLTISGDYVTKIVATTEEKDTATKSGELTKVYDNGDNTGYVKIGTKTYKIDDIDWLDVVINKKDKEFDDLIYTYKHLDDDEYLQVTITLDKNDYVIKIVATTKTE